MQKRRITSAQGDAVRNAIGRSMRYLLDLRHRMEVAGYAPNDDVCQAVLKAYNAMFSMGVTFHYASCEQGVCSDATFPGVQVALLGLSEQGEGIRARLAGFMSRRYE